MSENSGGVCNGMQERLDSFRRECRHHQASGLQRWQGHHSGEPAAIHANNSPNNLRVPVGRQCQFLTRLLLQQASKPPSKPKKKMVYFVKISNVVLDKDNISRMVRSYTLWWSVIVLVRTCFHLQACVTGCCAASIAKRSARLPFTGLHRSLPTPYVHCCRSKKCTYHELLFNYTGAVWRYG